MGAPMEIPRVPTMKCCCGIDYVFNRHQRERESESMFKYMMYLISIWFIWMTCNNIFHAHYPDEIIDKSSLPGNLPQKDSLCNRYSSTKKEDPVNNEIYALDINQSSRQWEPRHSWNCMNRSGKSCGQSK